MCGAENVAALAITGAIAQSLVALGPKYEAAVHSALDAAAAGLALVARSQNSGEATMSGLHRPAAARHQPEAKEPGRPRTTHGGTHEGSRSWSISSEGPGRTEANSRGRSTGRALQRFN